MESTRYTLISVGFILLTMIMYTLLIREFKKAIALTPWEAGRKSRTYNRLLYTLIIWTLFLYLVSSTGFFEDFSSFPPRLMIVPFVPLVVIVTVIFSKTTTELLPFLSARKLVYFQVFRFFVEILLWALFIQNLVPIKMTFEGMNFDILAGLTAPLAGYFLTKSRTGLYIWNLVSLCLLINIVSIAVLSLPTPLRTFPDEPSSAIMARFPFVLLPGMLVPLAYGLHFLSLRQLGLAKKT